MPQKIGVMGALPDEVKLLADQLQQTETRRVAGVDFITGTMGDRQVTLCCAGMGKVNAAAAAQLLISVFGAKALVFSGIAGNMSGKVGVGDLVISDTVVYHDAELPMIAQSYPYVSEYHADPALVRAAVAACEGAGIRHIVGKIATGDRFVADSALKQQIWQACRPDCVEMEGAAVAQVAAKNDLPFVILRTMSDDCDEGAREKLVVQQFDITEYCRTASTVTAAVLHALA